MPADGIRTINIVETTINGHNFKEKTFEDLLILLRLLTLDLSAYGRIF